MKIRICDYDKVYGFVDYGEFDLEKNGGRTAKMRCKKCGAAWLSENYVAGFDTCPECGANKKSEILVIGGF